jgi:hypothetical protein
VVSGVDVAYTGSAEDVILITLSDEVKRPQSQVVTTRFPIDSRHIPCYI